MPLIARVTDPQPGDQHVMHPNGLVTILNRTDHDTGRITMMYSNDRHGTIGVAQGWKDVPWDLWPLDPYEAPPPPEIGTRWRHEHGTVVEVVDTSGAGNLAHVTTRGQAYGAGHTNIVVFYGTHDPAPPPDDLP